MVWRRKRYHETEEDTRREEAEGNMQIYQLVDSPSAALQHKSRSELSDGRITPDSTKQYHAVRISPMC